MFSETFRLKFHVSHRRKCHVRALKTRTNFLTKFKPHELRPQEKKVHTDIQLNKVLSTESPTITKGHRLTATKAFNHNVASLLW